MVDSSDGSRGAEPSTSSPDTAIGDARTLAAEAETELGAIELAIERLAARHVRVV